MGGLRPIGSEKLSGMDKIRRIMEIATYDGNKGSNLNEDKENVFSVKLADNIDYVIVREKQGYIIKESFNGEINYLENIQERKYYKSYSQALKRLNLVAKEKNTLYENKKGTHLFEQSEKKKYYLDLGDKKKEETKSETPAVTEPIAQATTPTVPATPVAATPAPAPAVPAPAPATPAPLEEQGDNAMDPTAPIPAAPVDPNAVATPPADPNAVPADAMNPEVGLEGGEEMNPAPEEDMDMESEDGGEGKKEEITFKLIQKLTGKLAQKLRSYGEDKEMSSDNIKYVINSIISAIDVESLDEDDIEEIINRLEGEEEEGEEGMGSEEMDIDNQDTMGGMGPEPGLEGPPPTPEGAAAPPTGEMAEGFKNLSDAFVNKFKGAYSSVLADKMMEGQRRDKRRKKHSYSESTVDKIISKYFDIKEDEYLIKEESTRKEIEFIKRKNTQEIRRLSESLKQERMALKFIEKYPKARLIGSTTKKNLVFKQGLNERKITPDGKVL
jgi:hypothetical protein